MIDNNKLVLPDGRTVGYAEYGEPNGYPVFLLHGNPGSRLSWGLFPDCPFIPGIRIIAPDRPGYGLSGFNQQAIEYWPYDMSKLADHLGIDKFTILGVSGGGPYALVCAWKIPERLTGVGLVSSVGPYTPESIEGVIKSLRLLWKLAKPLFWLVRFQMFVMGIMAKRNPAKLMRRVRNLELSEKDAEIFDRPEIQNIFLKDFPEAYRQNGIGSAYDATIPDNWPIPLKDIEIKVNIWSTEEDQLVGKMGHYMASKLPNCEAVYVSDEGHLWILDHMEEVLNTVLTSNELGL